jgi:rfaE bifunctional protein nucleotidyltransferase chain/domain
VLVIESSPKLVTFDGLAALSSSFRNIGARVVHAHGCFDLLHIGHLRHLKQAKDFGTHLVVTVTDDPFVNKGQGRPVFTAEQRAEVLAELGCVDYVAINPGFTAVEAIHLLQPIVLVKGPECLANPTPALQAEIEAVELLGGCVRYTAGEKCSSTALVNRVLEYYG